MKKVLIGLMLTSLSVAHAMKEKGGPEQAQQGQPNNASEKKNLEDFKSQSIESFFQAQNYTEKLEAIQNSRNNTVFHRPPLTRQLDPYADRIAGLLESSTLTQADIGAFNNGWKPIFEKVSKDLIDIFEDGQRTLQACKETFENIAPFSHDTMKKKLQHLVTSAQSELDIVFCHQNTRYDNAKMELNEKGCPENIMGALFAHMREEVDAEMKRLKEKMQASLDNFVAKQDGKPVAQMEWKSLVDSRSQQFRTAIDGAIRLKGIISAASILEGKSDEDAFDKMFPQWNNIRKDGRALFENKGNVTEANLTDLVTRWTETYAKILDAAEKGLNARKKAFSDFNQEVKDL